MTNPWLSEISLIAGLLVAALLLGLLSDHLLLALWLVTVGYLAFHIYNLWRLEHWLSTGAGRPPRGGQGARE